MTGLSKVDKQQKKILFPWDFAIQTDRKIKDNRSDIEVKDCKSKT